MNRTLSSYNGGKARKAILQFILDRLPPVDHKYTYVEPFGGFLSVLLHRPPTINEIVNDVNDRIVNMWEMYQEHPTEFMMKIKHAPISEKIYNWAVDHIDYF